MGEEAERWKDGETDKAREGEILNAFAICLQLLEKDLGDPNMNLCNDISTHCV